MSGAKVGAIVTSALLVMYLALLGNFGIILINSPTALGKTTGFLILVFPAVGAWALVREFIFGLKVEKMAKFVEKQGTWPRFDLELRPSGRATRESADRVFEEFREKAMADENNWKVWFDLGLAYNEAGDRKRARLAMRKALKLSSE